MSSSFAESLAHDAVHSPTPPSAARVWDKLRGGKDNYETDAALSESLTDVSDDLARLALERPRFYARAVRHLAEECGIAQFIDISPGYPTTPDGVTATNLIAREARPGARTMYVQDDGIVAAHLRALVADDQTLCIEARRTHTGPVIEAASDFFDLSRRVAVLLRLDHLSGDDIASGYVGDLVDALCPGSFVVVSSITADGPFAAVALAAERWNRASVAAVRKLTDEGPPIFTHDTQRLVPRTAHQLAAILSAHHLTPLSPPLVSCSQWAAFPEPPRTEAVPDWVAVARKY
ncbi:SAM-dependent methyltransferase [Streptomyces sp. NBC_00443]|uniref:SAM-dependent methyltransferase n=1 Tax=Streptomyces sp. NBC_00443 TaxID=2975743 RepID=UPI002E24C7C0